MTRAVVTAALGWKAQRLTRLESGATTATLEELLALSRLYALEGLRMLDEFERQGGTTIRVRQGSV